MGRELTGESCCEVASDGLQYLEVVTEAWDTHSQFLK